MHKIVIALAVVVVVLAVGVVVAVTYLGGGRERGEVSVAPPAVQELAPAVESSEPAPAPKPAPAAKPVVKPAATAAKTEAPVANPLAQNDDPSAEARARIAAMLDGLSPADQAELMRQVREREMQRMRDRARYSLPSQFRLQALDRRGNGALKLSEYQQQQVDAIAESMRPKMDAALGPIWAKQEQLRQRAEALDQAGQGSAAEPLRQEMHDLRQQSETIRNSLDQEYRQLLSSVLTPEQSQALDSAETVFRDRGESRGAGRGDGQGRRASRGPGGGGGGNPGAGGPGG